MNNDKTFNHNVLGGKFVIPATDNFTHRGIAKTQGASGELIQVYNII